MLCGVTEWGRDYTMKAEEKKIMEKGTVVRHIRRGILENISFYALNFISSSSIAA
jgi:hypothetical protein